eukprot:SAG31_NODE_4740_length_2988_cov_1.861890_3_plen_364_part_00
MLITGSMAHIDALQDGSSGGHKATVPQIHSVPPHPYGVQPEGNIFLLGPRGGAVAARCVYVHLLCSVLFVFRVLVIKLVVNLHRLRQQGLGTLACLDDATLLLVLSFAGPRALANACAVSDALAAFASLEELWRVACLNRAATRREPVSMNEQTWKASYLGAHALPRRHKWCVVWVRRRYHFRVASAGYSRMMPAINCTLSIVEVCCCAGIVCRSRRDSHVAIYSDALYQPHQLAHGPSEFGIAPRGPSICRLDCSGGSAVSDEGIAQFTATYEAGAGTPVVLVGAGSATVESGSWSEPSMRAKFGQRVFHAGGFDFQLQDFLRYASNNTDDQPLYLFDPTFGAQLTHDTRKAVVFSSMTVIF